MADTEIGKAVPYQVKPGVTMTMRNGQQTSKLVPFTLPGLKAPKDGEATHVKDPNSTFVYKTGWYDGEHACRVFKGTKVDHPNDIVGN